jgi:hypothetical protein
VRPSNRRSSSSRRAKSSDNSLFLVSVIDQHNNNNNTGIFFRTDYLEEDHRVANLRNLLPQFGEGDGDDLNVCGSKSLVAKEEREEGH